MAETTALAKGDEAMLLGVEVDMRRASWWSGKCMYHGQGRMASIAEMISIGNASRKKSCLALPEL
jgi:hypothetical protein